MVQLEKTGSERMGMRKCAWYDQACRGICQVCGTAAHWRPLHNPRRQPWCGAGVPERRAGVCRAKTQRCKVNLREDHVSLENKRSKTPSTEQAMGEMSPKHRFLYEGKVVVDTHAENVVDFDGGTCWWVIFVFYVLNARPRAVHSTWHAGACMSTPSSQELF